MAVSEMTEIFEEIEVEGAVETAVVERRETLGIA
jgi:hypothetical protein